MKKLKRLLSTLIMSLTCLTAVAPTTLALAADVETQYAFDNTAIEVDLASVDLLLYQIANKTDLIMLVERDISSDNAAIYLYVYNATKITLSETSASNVVNMAEAYDATSFEPTSYRNFKLKFCDKTDDKSVYKFRVLDEDNVIIKNALSSDTLNGERRYDVAGVQLLFEASQLAVDYPVEKTYFYEGDFKDSTLSVNELDTVQLEVHPAWYRTDSSSKGPYYRNQLNSVYFAVDYSILAKQGALQKVKAEWYEYKTEPIVVVEDESVYNKLLPWVGVNIGTSNESVPYNLAYGREETVLGSNIASPGEDVVYDWCYNLPKQEVAYYYKATKSSNILSWLFTSYGKDYMKHNIPSKELTDYIYSYSASADKGYLPIKNGKVSADLFLNSVDEGRTQGYNVTEISVDDKYDLFSYDATHNFWDTVCDYGLIKTLFGWTPSDASIKNVVPIYKVTSADMKKDEIVMSNDLLIDEELLTDFVKFVDENEAQSKATFLFRFAATDYLSAPLSNIQNSHENIPIGYAAQETVFLDFDILELTFKNDVGETVLPIVASPIDHVATVVPPKLPPLAWWVYCLIVGIVSIVGLILSIKFRRNV